MVSCVTKRARNVYCGRLHDRVSVCASIVCASIVAAIPGDLLCGPTDTTQWVCSHHTTHTVRVTHTSSGPIKMYICYTILPSWVFLGTWSLEEYSIY